MPSFLCFFFYFLFTAGVMGFTQRHVHHKSNCVGCEKSHLEVLVVKLDHKLRFLGFGEKRKKRIKVC